MEMRLRFLAWIPLVALALFLTACGEEQEEAVKDEKQDAPAAETKPAPGTEVAPEEEGPKSIDEAIAKGDLGAVKGFVADDPAAASTGARPTLPPLHQAILRQKADIALFLIQSGADVAALDSRKRTPLHLCVERNQPDLVIPIIEAGGVIDARDQDGWTVLHHAGAKNLPTIAKLFLDQGATINIISELGGTPMHEAAASGGAEIIQLFLDAGVDTSVVAEGGTALDVATELENTVAVELLSR